jgi:MinD superfamily P-loop ATPase
LHKGQRMGTNEITGKKDAFFYVIFHRKSDEILMKFTAVINKLILTFLFSVKNYDQNVVKKIQESNIYYGRKFCRNFCRNHCIYAQKNRPLEVKQVDNCHFR